MTILPFTPYLRSVRPWTPEPRCIESRPFRFPLRQTTARQKTVGRCGCLLPWHSAGPICVARSRILLSVGSSRQAARTGGRPDTHRPDRHSPHVALFRKAAHFRSASNAGHKTLPNFVNAYSTFGGTCGCTVRCTMPSRSSSRSCWINIFCETAGMARSNSENRNTGCTNRWKIITSFQRPSNILSACSVSRAASVAADGPL